jgi:hypothetical protein
MTKEETVSALCDTTPCPHIADQAETVTVELTGGMARKEIYGCASAPYQSIRMEVGRIRAKYFP